MAASRPPLCHLDGFGYYLCSINDLSASVWVDLQITRHLSLERYPHFHAIRVEFDSVNENGFATPGENKVLDQLEDLLAEHVTIAVKGKYVGNVSTNGYRDFYFYGQVASLPEESQNLILEKFPDYGYNSWTKKEPGWDTYFECLYPNEMACQYIVLDQSFAVINNVNLRESVSVRYFFYFDDRNGVDLALHDLKGLEGIHTALDSAAPLGYFRLVIEEELPFRLLAVYNRYEELVAHSDHLRRQFSHCEIDDDEYAYNALSNEVRKRIAADVASGLRSADNLSRFGVSSNGEWAEVNPDDLTF